MQPEPGEAPATDRSPSDAVGDYPHGRVPRKVRERQILDLAEELFAERGFQATSMDELARRAGVSKPVVYDLMGSKEALYRRCFERASDELAESVSAATAAHADDPAAQIRAGVGAFFQFIDGHRRAWAMLFTQDTGGRAATYVSDIRARQARLVAGVLAERAAAAGVDVDGQRLEAVAHALNGASEALANWWRDNPGLEPGTLADWLVELVLPGLERLTA